MSKIRNMVYGLALGDALGFRVEAEEHKTIVNGYLHENFDDIQEKLWVSDDTTMSLYLLKAIEDTYNPELSLKEQASDLAISIGEYFIKWYDNPDCLLGRGHACKNSLAALKAHLASQPLIKDMFYGSTDESKGSGTLMRSPWLGVLHAKGLLNDEELENLCTIQSLVTHRSLVAIHTSYLSARITSALYTGKIKPSGIRNFAEELCIRQENDEGWDEILESLSKIDEIPANYPQIALEEYDPSSTIGYDGMASTVLSTAILLVDTFSSNPVDVLRRSMFTGGDSDTIGAVAGAMTGVSYDTEIWENIEDLIEDFIIDELEATASYLRLLPES